MEIKVKRDGNFWQASEESLSDVCEDEEPDAGAEEYLKRDDFESLVGEAGEEYEESLTDEHQPWA